eukprot:15060769-Alexandrium_andersonii.AAC.1
MARFFYSEFTACDSEVALLVCWATSSEVRASTTAWPPSATADWAGAALASGTALVFSTSSLVVVCGDILTLGYRAAGGAVTLKAKSGHCTPTSPGRRPHRARRLPDRARRGHARSTASAPTPWSSGSSSSSSGDVQNAL